MGGRSCKCSGGASSQQVSSIVANSHSNIIQRMDYRMDGIKEIGDRVYSDTKGIREDISELKLNAIPKVVKGIDDLALAFKRGEAAAKALNETATKTAEKAEEIGKGVVALKEESGEIKENTREILNTVNQVLVAMNVNNVAIVKNFEQLVENAKEIAANQEAINRNYEYVQGMESRLNEKFVTAQRSLIEIESKLETTLSAIQIAKNDINANIDQLRAELKQDIKDARTGPIIAGINIFVDYFLKEEGLLKSLTPQQRIDKIAKPRGILDILKGARSPNSDSLHSLLSNIIIHGYALPKDEHDEKSLVMLGLLCYGVHIYSSIVTNINIKYSMLADHYYQINGLDRYNEYLSQGLENFKEFATSLLGNNQDGIVDQVIEVLKSVRKRDYIKNDRKDVMQLAELNIFSLNKIKDNLRSMGELLDQIAQPNKLEYKPDFSESSVVTPIGKWLDGKEVRYAVQFRNKKGTYSRVSAWSRPYTILGKACPVVSVPPDPFGRVRLIFRKFNDELPQLVASIVDGNQTDFRDINRDVFNAASESNEAIALKELDVLVRSGADVNDRFEDEQRAIHAAAQNNNIEVAKALLQNGANIDAQDRQGLAAIHIATEAGFGKFVEMLLDQSADMNLRSKIGMTALHNAVSRGRTELVRLLLDKSKQLKVSAKNHDGYTPLHMAAMSGNAKLVELLCEDSRTSLDAKNKNLLTPLHVASMYNHAPVVKLLLEHGANINAKAYDDVVPLHEAAKAGSKDVVNLLVSVSNIELNAKTTDGFTALHFAIHHKHLNVALQLIALEQIEVNGQGGGDSLTPLHLAAKWGEEKVVSALLNKGAKLETLSKGDLSALHFAVANARASIASTLVNHGSDRFAKTEVGSLPLHLAAYSGDKEISEFTNELAVNSRDANEYTPLYVAFKYDNREVATNLLSHSANIHLRLGDYKTQLHHAAQNGDVNAASYFLEQGLHVNSTDLAWSQPLHYAARNGHVEIVRLLLSKGANSNGRDSEHRTPLHAVLELDNEAMMFAIAKLLLQNQADINAVNKDNLTLLHMASKQGYLSFVEFLVKHRANVNISLQNTCTPLQIAAENNRLKVVSFLLDKSAKINIANYKGQTVLHSAILGNGNLEMVKLLVEKGADVSVKDHEEHTLVDHALEKRKMDIVMFLVEKSVDSTNLKANGWTLLHYATKHGTKQLVEMLVHKGIRINTKNFDGQTPLHVAVKESNDHEMIQYLIAKSADVQTKDNQGSTLMIEAARRGVLEIGMILEESGASLAEANQDKQAPLHLAAAEGHLDFVKWLLEKGLQDHINDKDVKGKTALQLAVEGKGDVTLAKLLVDNGADIKTVDNDGNTLVISAAIHNKLKVIQYLVEKGVDFNVANSSSFTALHFASAMAHIELLSYLINLGMNVDAKDAQGRTPVHVAILERGNLQVVQLLAENKAYLKSKDAQGNSLLDSALASGKMDIVVFLVEANSGDISSQNKAGWSVFHYSAVEGDVRVLESLFQHDKQVDVKNEDGQTPLHITVKEKGGLDIVKFLVGKGADVNTVDKAGSSLVLEAAVKNKLDVAKFLVQNKADFRGGNNQGITPLHGATREGHLMMAKFLAGGAHINFYATDVNGEMPLHYAVRNKRSELIQFFIHSTNQHGSTMMHQFAEWGNLGMIQYIINLGASVNSLDKEQSSPLHIAAKFGHLPVVKFLVSEKCVDVELKNTANRTPLNEAEKHNQQAIVEYLHLNHKLYDAIEKGNTQFVRTLTRKGVGIKCSNSKGWNPLHMAAYHGQLDIVEFLLAQGLRSWDKTQDGQTVYELAKAKNHTYVMDYLRTQSEGLVAAIEFNSMDKAKEYIRLGADINFADTRSWTPLHRAAFQGKLEFVKMLVEMGANTLVKAHNGQTPLDLANNSGAQDVFEYLTVVDRNEIYDAIKGDNFVRLKQFHRERDIIKLSDAQGWTPLHIAAYHGKLEMVKFLIDIGANTAVKTANGQTALELASMNDQQEVVRYFVNASNKRGWHMLHEAAAKNDLARVKSLLDNSANVNAKNDKGDTVLMVSIKEKGHLEMAKLLVDRGASIETKNHSQSSPLHEAIDQDKQYIANFLIERGADVSSSNSHKWTALHFACKICSLDMVRVLLKKGASIDEKNEDGKTPLHVAIDQKGCSLQMVILLVASGASIKTVDRFGSSLVYAATANNKPDITHFLILEGADYWLPNKEGNAPLHAAAKHGLTELVKQLIRYNININARNRDDESALDIALTFGREDVATLLVQSTYDKGMTILHDAAREGDASLVRLLVSRHASINQLNNDGYSPLHCAVQGNNLDVVKYLVQHGANTCTKTKEGKTPLDLAVDQDAPEIVEYLEDKAKKILFEAIEFGSLQRVNELITKGAGYSCGRPDGELPVHVAARFGRLKVLQYLKEKGADMTVRNGDGLSPLDLAIENKHDDVRKYLANNSNNFGWSKFHEAAQQGDLELMRKYLKSGANVNMENYTKLTPLHLAAQNGHLEAVKLLIESGADVNARNIEGKSAIRFAIKGRGKIDMIKLLVESGADIHDRDEHNSSLILEATAKGKVFVIKFLIQMGGSVNESNLNRWTPLHEAAAKGNFALIKLFLSKGAHVNVVNSDGRTPLQVAIMSNRSGYDIVKLLIDNGANLNVKDDKWNTLTLDAIVSGKLTVAELLIESGADVVSRNALGWTPLHAAVSKNDLKLVETLLSKDVDINEQDGKGQTPLFVAANTRNSLAMVTFLVNKGAKLHILPEDGSTLLFGPISLGNLNVVSYLIQSGVDVNAPNGKGSTALHEAVKSADRDFVELLLNKGALIDATDGEGKTPLHLAVNMRKIKLPLIEFLVKKGARLDVVDANKATLMFEAVQQNRLDVAEFLMSHSVDINAPNSKGKTPLHEAAEQNNFEMIKLLLRNNDLVNIDYQNAYGQTPLQVVIDSKRGSLDIVLYFVGKGANVRTMDNNYSTLVLNAADRNKWEIMRYLIDRGADFKAPNKSGCTPLHLAAKYDNLKMVQFLLTKGAFVDARLSDGRTALHLAVESGSLKVVKCLIENKANTAVRSEILGQTPLDLAIARKKYVIAKELIQVKYVPISGKRKRRDAGQELAPVKAVQINESNQFLWSGKSLSSNSVKRIAEKVSGSSKESFPNSEYPSKSSLIAPNIDVNGTLLLLDVFTRKVSGNRHFVQPPVKPMTVLEARSVALNMSEEFVRNISKLGNKFGLSIDTEEIDSFKLYQTLEALIIKRDFVTIQNELSLASRKAYSGKGKDKFEVILKQALDEILENFVKN